VPHQGCPAVHHRQEGTEPDEENRRHDQAHGDPHRADRLEGLRAGPHPETEEEGDIHERPEREGRQERPIRHGEHPGDQDRQVPQPGRHPTHGDGRPWPTLEPGLGSLELGTVEPDVPAIALQ
jgi:hypothetical protein